jgi:mono/diheme cytochrome c family protein
VRAAVLLPVIALAGCGSSAAGPKTPRQTFAGSCGTCHTLHAAGTSGTFGPDLDRLKPSEALVRATIHKGPGPMPADLLTGKGADAVARYVSSAASGG